MSGLYKHEFDLTTNNGSMSTSQVEDWGRYRLFGHSDKRYFVVPPVAASLFFKNDGRENVQIRRSAAVPIVVAPGEAAHIMLDGSTNGMVRVGS